MSKNYKLSFTAAEIDDRLGKVTELAEKSDIPVKLSELENDVGFVTTINYTETDPTVPAWAKAATKPTYTATEVGALPASTFIPSSLFELEEDTEHRTVTDIEKLTWDQKADISDIPTSVGELENDCGYAVAHEVASQITSAIDSIPDPSWGDITNKPFGMQEGTTGSDTLYWDGNATGHITYNDSGTIYVKIANVVPAADVFRSGGFVTVISPSGTKTEYDTAKHTTVGSSGVVTVASRLLVVPENIVGNTNVIFPEAGVWIENDGYKCVVKLNDYTGFPVIKPIDEQYLPESVASKSYVAESIAAIEMPDVAGQISTHNTSTEAHSDIREALSNKAAAEHRHDNLYYTEVEIDTKLSGKSDTSHSHDNRYYTEDEIDTKLSGKSDTSHKHDSAYDAKGAASDALTDAKAYADGLISDLLDGASDATLDSIRELAEAIKENDSAIDTLNGIASGKANAEHKHEISDINQLPEVINEFDVHAIDSVKHITNTERNKLTAAYNHSQEAHAPSNAQPNQNAFSNIKVGSTTIAADSTTDTLTLVAGSNITITPDATNDKVTIAATDTVYTHPNSGVTAGTYKSVTVNAQGHVTGGSNPTTLSGYGITDAATKTHTHTASDVGAVPTSRTVNGKDLSANITLVASDVGAAAASHGNHVPATETANNAKFLRNDNTWQTVTPANIGAAASSHGTHVTYATATPKSAGTAAVGTSSKVAREDHVHPAQTSITGNAETATKATEDASGNVITATYATKTELNAVSTLVGDTAVSEQISEAIANKSDTSHTHNVVTDNAPGFMNQAMLQKLSYIPLNAEENQNAFSNIVVGSTTIAADSKTDSLTIAAGTGISVAGDATNDKVTITNSGVRSISTGSSNGTISVNTNGTSANVAVKGLGSAAYTASSAYDAAGTADSALASAKTYTDEAISNLINSAPTTLDTLGEIATAMAENAGVVAALEASIGNKANASDLTSHTGNTTVHITSTERTNWNTAYNHSQAAHARTDATKVADSSTNGNILINGTETNVYTLPSASSALGGVKSGGDVTISSGVITVNDDSHNHVISNVDGLQDALDGKAASSHTHNYAGSSSAGGAAASANKVNNSLVVKLNGGTTEGTNMFTFNGSAAKSVNITPSAIGASASSHTHDDIYYTESEVDSKLSGKSNSGHKHTVSHTPAGTVSKPTFTGSAVTSDAASETTTVYSITAVGSLPSLSASVTNRCLTLTFGAGSLPTKGSGVSVATGAHTHSVTANGSVSQPTFTGTAATLTTSVDN